MKFNILIFLLLGVAFSAIEKDLVESLPGWTENNGTLYSKMYAGYLPAGAVY